MRYTGLILLLCLLATSCKKDTFVAESDFGYAYQPKELGHWVEYEVDSITYSDITIPASIDTIHYYLREVLDTTFVDASGAEVIRVEQYKRYDLSDPWVIYQVGSFKVSSENFQRYFNDLRFVNLLFPVREDKEWQGNIFLDVNNEATLEYLDDSKYDWRYRYTYMDQPMQIGNFSLDSCLQVVQIDEENLFEKKYSEEQYAKHVGLISKELIILNTQAPPSSQSFLERAEIGFIIRYKLIDYNH